MTAKTNGKGAKATSLENFVCEKTAGPGLGSCLLLLSEFWLAATRTREEGKEVCKGWKETLEPICSLSLPVDQGQVV